MVNWDVVGRNVDTLTTMIKQGWAKLTGDKADLVRMIFPTTFGIVR